MPGTPTSSSAANLRQQRGDSAGLIVSGVCLAHCLLAPAIAALVPALALGFDHRLDRLLHWALLLLAAPISAWTFRQGIRTHGRRRWMLVGLCGLGLMLAGVLVHTNDHSELWLTTVGVSILAGAHIMNWVSTLRIGCSQGPATIK